MYELYALFPFEQVEKNSRVIVYGAGRAGLNFVRQADSAGYCKVVCMVDKDSSKHNAFVHGLEQLLETDTYDYVVISPINFAIRERIRDDLLAYGVPAEKIVVPSYKNLMYWSLDGMLQHSLEGITVKEYDAVEMDARTLVSADRLDIGIKWLLLRDLVNGVENTENKSLYARHILAWTRGREGFMPTSGRIRDGVEEYIRCAKELIDNIKENGFDKTNPVPISADNEPLDGVHRIASCIEADVPVWVRRCPGLKPDIKPYTWYQENGFNTNDLLRIYRAFCDLYPGKFGIAVMYGPAMEYWGFMIKQLEHKFKVVGYADLDFESNYIGFETLLNDMYCYKWAYGDEKITRKIDALKLAPLKLRVAIVSDEACDGEDLFGQLRDFKLVMREATFFDFEDVELQIHTSDNEYEARHLSRVLLSPNNLNNVCHRFKPQYRKAFIEYLVKFKKSIMEHEVSLENVCIINSSVMEVMGIRECVEIDFICLEEDYEKLSDLSCYRTKKKNSGDIELCPEFYSTNEVKNFIADDNCHFIFFGLKFLNLEYVKKKKAFRAREKDIRDIRLIDLFNEMVQVYDEKAALQKGIYAELARRRLN